MKHWLSVRRITQYIQMWLDRFNHKLLECQNLLWHFCKINEDSPRSLRYGIEQRLKIVCWDNLPGSREEQVYQWKDFSQAELRSMLVWKSISDKRKFIKRFSAYSPESNGLAESCNRTLLSKERAMLIDSRLGPRLWGEAALYAAHLNNVSPSAQYDAKKPFELLFRRAPIVNTLRVFGCFPHIHVLAEKRPWKLPCRSSSVIMMGHKNGLYRI